MADLATLYIKVDSTDVKRADRDFDKLTGASRKTEKATDSVAKAFTKLASIMKTLAFAAVAAGIAATTYALKKSIEQFASFEKELANVSTLVDTNVVSMAKFQKELFALDSNLGSVTELTKGLYQALSAGVDAAKAVEFVGKAALAAKAGLSDTFTAVDAGTTILNAFGISTDKATDIYDLMFTTVKEGKTTFAELASSVGKISPIASAAGVSVTEMHAALATLTKGGFATREASARLATALGTIIKPSSEAQELAKSLGLEFNATALRAKGLHGFLQDVAKATGGNVDQLALLFGGMESLSVMLALTGKQSQEFTDILDRMGDVSGATKEAFDKQKVTLTALWDTFKNTIGKQAIILGEKLAPKIKEIIDKMSVWFDTNKDIIEQNSEVIKLLVSTIEILGTLIITMGKVIKLGVEFTNVWVKTWQALGLASTGMIDFNTALFDGVAALETFNEALGPEKLRLAFLERVIATGKYTSKVYWEAKRLRELIDALPDIDVAKPKEDKDDKKKPPSIVEPPPPPPPLDDSWIKRMQAQEAFAIKMSVAEQERLNERYELEKEINAKIHDELLSDTEFRIQELDKQFLAADSFVKDKAMLDEWYVKKYEEIVGTQEQAYMDLYNNLGILTQEAYDQIYETYVKDRDDFIALTGDKETAHQVFTERLNALNEEMEVGNKTWIDGAKAGLESYAESSNDAFTNIKELAVSSLQGMEDALVEFAMTGKLNMKQLAASIIKDLIRMAVQAAITKAIMAGLSLWPAGGGATSSAGSVAPVSASTPTTGVGQSPQLMAKGGIFANGLSSHSNTIVDSPTFFSFARGQGLMGEAGPEAIMPLTRLPSGDLGVKTESGKADIPAMTVNIHEAPGTQTRVEQSEDGQSLEVIIEQVEQSMQSRMSRGTGMAPFMDGRYGRAY